MAQIRKISSMYLEYVNDKLNFEYGENTDALVVVDDRVIQNRYNLVLKISLCDITEYGSEKIQIIQLYFSSAK